MNTQAPSCWEMICREVARRPICSLVPLMKRIRIAQGVVLLSFLLVSTLALGQTPTQTQTAALAKRQRVSLPALYRHFLAYQNHLDRVGTALDQKGEDGSEFRNHFQRILGFSDAEFAPIRDTALRLEQELKQHDAKIKAVIDATRAQHPRVLRSVAELPPLPPELVQLQKDRDALIEREVTQLNTALGAQGAVKLQKVIENDFAPNVRVQSVHPPGPHDPTEHPIPPFPPEVRQ